MAWAAQDSVMQFAHINSIRAEATPFARATCPQCSGTVIAKCGHIVVNHWAHERGEDCDPWSESETPWHRLWKSFASRTEVTIKNHRADIISSTGKIIELQHSGISVEEIRARELCYGRNLRWLFDGTDLPVRAPKNNFQDYGIPESSNPRLCLRHRETTYRLATDTRIFSSDLSVPLGWEYVTFRWYHPRKHYGYTSQPTYIDLPGHFVLKLGKLHLEDGAPYGGWGHLVPRTTVEQWMR